MPYRLFFDPCLKSGKRPLYLETLHEQPVHAVIVSEDLHQFAHIHPMPETDGGCYRTNLDYSLPDEGRVIREEVTKVEGAHRTAGPLVSGRSAKRSASGISWCPLHSGARPGFQGGWILSLPEADGYGKWAADRRAAAIFWRLGSLRDLECGR